MKRAVAGMLLLLLTLPSVSLTTGCDDDAMREFRQAASQDLADGLKTILDAVVDGLFEVIEPDSSSDSSSGTGSSSGSGSSSGTDSGSGSSSSS